MTGLIRKRAKAGMTIPAAPRMTSASLKPGSAGIRPRILPLCRHRARLSAAWRRTTRSPASSAAARRDDGGPAVRPRRRARVRCSRSMATSSAISAATPSIPRPWRSSTELGLLERLPRAPARQGRATLSCVIAGRDWTIADLVAFRPALAPFIAMMPQWEFLDFVARRGARPIPASRCAMERRGRRASSRKAAGSPASASRDGERAAARGWSSPPTAARSLLRAAAAAAGRGPRRADGRLLVPAAQDRRRRTTSCAACSTPAGSWR